jgi:hypothetical protein
MPALLGLDLNHHAVICNLIGQWRDLLGSRNSILNIVVKTDTQLFGRCRRFV